jgi:carboxymethylenebutenolidase
MNGDTDNNNINSEDIANVFDEHVKCEFEKHDVEATMKTMVKEPYVHHIPVLTGGIGYDGVYNFYKIVSVGKMPTDTKIVPISRTVSKDQVVDELIFSFTHDIEFDSILPGIPPTGKYVEVPLVAIIKFDGDKIAHEHIYWDQASVLAQIGLIDTKSLPIVGIEQARKLLEISQKNIETGKQ